MPREVLGRGPGPPLAAAEDGVRLQSRVQLLGQYLIGTPVPPSYGLPRLWD